MVTRNTFVSGAFGVSILIVVALGGVIAPAPHVQIWQFQTRMPREVTPASCV